MSNKSEQSTSVVDPALQVNTFLVTEDWNLGALTIHHDDEDVHIAVKLKHRVDCGDSCSFGANPLGKRLRI
jgi:hypothetical protein